MRYLVTGGAGFIGSNIVKRLLRDGHEVVVIDDMSLGREENIPSGAEVFKGDVRERELIERATSRGIDGIFHDAAKSSAPMFYPDPREGVDVNVRGFLNIMEVAREQDIPVVYASTSSLYSRCQPPHREDMVVRPGSFYEYSFYAREGIASLYAELYGMRSVGLRYFSVYGPGEEHKGGVREQHISVHMGDDEREEPCNIRRWNSDEGLHFRGRCGGSKHFGYEVGLEGRGGECRDRRVYVIQ